MLKAWYLNQNPDVKEGKINFLRHWVLYGKNEGRKIFPPLWYLKFFLFDRRFLDSELSHIVSSCRTEKIRLDLSFLIGLKRVTNNYLIKKRSQNDYENNFIKTLEKNFGLRCEHSVNVYLLQTQSYNFLKRILFYVTLNSLSDMVVFVNFETPDYAIKLRFLSIIDFNFKNVNFIINFNPDILSNNQDVPQISNFVNRLIVC